MSCASQHGVCRPQGEATCCGSRREGSFQKSWRAWTRLDPSIIHPRTPPESAPRIYPWTPWFFSRIYPWTHPWIRLPVSVMFLEPGARSTADSGEMNQTHCFTSRAAELLRCPLLYEAATMRRSRDGAAGRRQGPAAFCMGGARRTHEQKCHTHVKKVSRLKSSVEGANFALSEV